MSDRSMSRTAFLGECAGVDGRTGKGMPKLDPPGPEHDEPRLFRSRETMQVEIHGGGGSLQREHVVEVAGRRQHQQLAH